MVRIFLGVNTLLFLSFGVWAFFTPDQMAETLGATSLSSDGMYELRSNYGGVSMGIGLACLAAVFRDGLRRPALYLLLAYTGGYFLGRILALPMDGVPSAKLLGYSAYEGINALLAWLLLLRTGKEE